LTLSFTARDPKRSSSVRNTGPVNSFYRRGLSAAIIPTAAQRWATARAVQGPKKQITAGGWVGLGSQRQNPISEYVTFHTVCAVRDIDLGLVCADGRTRGDGTS